MKTASSESNGGEREITSVPDKATACPHRVTFDSMPASCSKCGAIEGSKEWDDRRGAYVEERERRPSDATCGLHGTHCGRSVVKCHAFARIPTCACDCDVCAQRSADAKAPRPTREEYHAAHERLVADSVTMTVHGHKIRVINSADCNALERALDVVREEASNEAYWQDLWEAAKKLVALGPGWDANSILPFGELRAALEATEPRGRRRERAIPEAVTDHEVREAVAQVNDLIGIDPRFTHKGDELKCWTPDRDGEPGKTYLSAAQCAELANAFHVLSVRLTPSSGDSGEGTKSQ